MPFTIPSELFSISGNIPISPYKNIDQSEEFVLQKRKSSGLYALQIGDEPLYRIIITVGETVYMLAYENDWKTIQELEWPYILFNFRELVPQSLTLEQRNKWILAHFTQLAVETSRDSSDPFMTTLTRDVSLSSQYFDSQDDDDEEESETEDNSYSDVKTGQNDNIPDVTDTVTEKKKEVVSSSSSDMNKTHEKRIDEFVAKQTSQREYSRMYQQRSSKRNSNINTKDTNNMHSKKSSAIVMDMFGLRLCCITLTLVNLTLIMLRDLSPSVFLLTQIFISTCIIFIMVLKDPISFRIILTIKSLSSSNAEFLPEDDDINQIEGNGSKQYNDVDVSYVNKGAFLSIEDTEYRSKLDDRNETVSKSKWGDADPKSFVVRAGPNYKWNKIKKRSQHSLYHLAGVDIFKHNTKVKTTNICSKIDISSLSINFIPGSHNIPTSSITSILTTPSIDTPQRPRTPSKVVRLNSTQDSVVPELFVVNFLLPTYAPSAFSKVEDGKGRSLVIYFALKEETNDLLQLQNPPPSIDLLKRFMYSCRTAGNLRSRLKVIPRLCNMKELKLSSALKTLLEQYNSKPFLTGPLYHTFFHDKRYVECDVDIHRYCYWARKVAYDIIQWLPEAIIELAFVVEAQTDEEMPEQVLGTVRLNYLHPFEDAKNLEDVLIGGENTDTMDVADNKVNSMHRRAITN